MGKQDKTSIQEKAISKEIIEEISYVLTREVNTIDFDSKVYLKSISDNVLIEIGEIVNKNKKVINVEGNSEINKTRKKKVPQKVRERLKWILVLCWERIKQQKTTHLYKYREYLLYMAMDYLTADEFSDLRLVLPRKRRYVTDIEKVKAINMDQAREILDYLRYERPPKDKNEVVLHLMIELLWQGIPMRHVLEMNIFSFNPKQNIIHIKTYNTYDSVSADPTFWARFDGLLRKISEYYLSYRAKKTISFREYYPGKKGYVAVNNLLRTVARKIKIKARKGINLTNFVEAGKASKIFCLNTKPSYFSSLSGRKPNTTVQSLRKWYPKLRDMVLKSDSEETHKDCGDRAIDLTSTTKEYLKMARKILLQYENAEQKEEIIEKLKELRKEWFLDCAISNGKITKGLILKHLVNSVQTKVLIDSIQRWDVQKMRAELKRQLKSEQSPLYVLLEKELNSKEKISFLDIADWIIFSCEQKLVGKSVMKYLSTIGRMLVYCELYDINMLQLDEEDFELMILNQDPVSENNQVRWINKNTFDDIITAFNSLYIFMEPTKPLKRIEFNKLRYLVDNSPKIVYIPEENEVKAKIKSLLDQKKEKQALICILGCYLGLRRQEMLDLKKRNIRIYNGKYDYIVFIGKGGKERHVYLNLLPESPVNYKSIFYSFFKGVLNQSHDTLLDIEKMDQLKNIFDNDLKDTFIDGIHSMRRFFATQCSKDGLSVQQISCILGHESLSMLKTYNQNRFRNMEQEAKSKYQELPDEISERQLADFLVCSDKDVYRLIKGIELCRNRKRNANRKMREKVNFVKLQFIYSSIQNKLEKKFANVPCIKRAKVLLKAVLPISKEGLSQKVLNEESIPVKVELK